MGRELLLAKPLKQFMHSYILKQGPFLYPGTWPRKLFEVDSQILHETLADSPLFLLTERLIMRELVSSIRLVNIEV
jgi:hypothetical protein